MPFTSQAQWKACFAMQKQGTSRGWNCKKFAKETKTPFKELPKYSPNSKKTHKIYTGPRGGKYYIKNGYKVYLKRN